MRRRFGTRKARYERLPRGDGAIKLLLGHETLADLEQDLRHARIEWVLRGKFGPDGACLVELLAALVIGRNQELGVENRALGVGALGSIRKLGEVVLEAGDGFGKPLLSLKNLGDLIRSCHR